MPQELIQRAAAQPEITVERLVRAHGPALTALLESGRPLLLSEIEADPDQHWELQRFRYGHLLGEGVSDDALSAWQALHPHSRLSPSVIDLLRQIDGIHLWADLDCGRSYFGVLPLAEWQPVHEHEAAILFQEVPADALVLSYHDNGDYYLLLEPAVDRFTWFDPQSWRDSKVVATTVDAFLSWWWGLAQELDPRAD